MLWFPLHRGFKEDRSTGEKEGKCFRCCVPHTGELGDGNELSPVWPPSAPPTTHTLTQSHSSLGTENGHKAQTQYIWHKFWQLLVLLIRNTDETTNKYQQRASTHRIGSHTHHAYRGYWRTHNNRTEAHQVYVFLLHSTSLKWGNNRCVQNTHTKTLFLLHLYVNV